MCLFLFTSSSLYFPLFGPSLCPSSSLSPLSHPSLSLSFSLFICAHSVHQMVFPKWLRRRWRLWLRLRLASLCVAPPPYPGTPGCLPPSAVPAAEGSVSDMASWSRRKKSFSSSNRINVVSFLSRVPSLALAPAPAVAEPVPLPGGNEGNASACVRERERTLENTQRALLDQEKHGIHMD